MECIYEPIDLMQAQMLLSVLATEGLEAHLLGADLIGGMGELPALGLLRLMVNDEDAVKAKLLIDNYLSATPCVEEVEAEDMDLSISQTGVLLC